MSKRKDLPLHRSAEEGDLEKVKHFIEMDGISASARDSSNRTPLQLAARCGQFKVVEYLIKTDAEHYIMGCEGATAINLAAEHGHKDIVDLLLRFGAHFFHYRLFAWWTVLHFASKRGWMETVQYIIEGGTLNEGDLDVTTPLGMTSLMLAADEGHVGIVQLLIQADAKVSLRDDNNWTALHFASKRGWASIVESIVKHAKCDLNAKDSCGNTPLHIACGMNNTEIIQLLLKAGADCNIRNNKNDVAFSGQETAVAGDLEKGIRGTNLHIASQRGWKEMVQRIVESVKDKTDLDKRTPLGMTSLMLAVDEGHVGIVQLLIEAGAQINLSDDNSWTALHFASNRGWIPIVETILKTSKGDLNAKDSSGNTPLHIACNMNNLKVIELLLKAGADGYIENNKNAITTGFLMHREARVGDLWSVKHLIDLGVSVDSPDHNHIPIHYAAKCGCAHNTSNTNPKVKSGYAPVLLAAKGGHRDIVNLLLQCGAPATYAEDFNYTLFHWASHHGWADTIQHLVQNGELDINATTCSGETPLMRAAKRSEDVAAFLIRAGAEVNLCDKSKGTALHFASGKGHLRTVRILLQKAEVNLNPKDEDGNTPLHKACTSGQTGVARMLLTAGAKTDVKNNCKETAFSVGLNRERLNIEEIRLFLLHGAFMEDYDYVRVSRNPDLKAHILEDATICTSLIVNKFNNHSLPAVYSNFEFANKLPPIKDLEISCQQKHSIMNFVESDIESNTFCNITKARPIVLTFMCVQSLLSHQSTMKRFASNDGNSPTKKTRFN